MTKSTSNPFRAAIQLFAASSLFVAINANAQDVDRYFQVDKPLLETMINSQAIYLQYPVLIVAPNEGRALPSNISQNKPLTGVPITLYDNYVETTAQNNDIIFKLIYLGESSKGNGFEFNLSNYNGVNYLMSSSGKLSIGTSETVFTLNFDESDENCFLLQPNYKQSSTDYSINYDESTKEFSLASENMKGIRLYMFDNMGFSTAEASLSDDLSTISINLNPYTEIRGTQVFIKYILNNGEDVPLSDLIASEHYLKVTWPKDKQEPVTISLPNYNQEATTLWAIPALDLGTNPEAPIGPIFQSTYADVSTGITATKIAADDTAPVYYTIQGVQVSHPTTPGIYLCRRGSDVSKILVK